MMPQWATKLATQRKTWKAVDNAAHFCALFTFFHAESGFGPTSHPISVRLICTHAGVDRLAITLSW